VLEINNQRLMPYHSTYYDTPDHMLYLSHHNGARPRYKVRFRDYLVSDRSFFEIKRKTNKDKTKKKRIEVPFHTHNLTEESQKFLEVNRPLGKLNLISTLENSFSRITLAGFASNERVTLDVDMSYRNKRSELSMAGLVIAEIKQGSASKNSPMLQTLHDMHLCDAGFSKYCIGLVSLVDGLKYNNFKPKLLTIKKILG
jgi:hypothetical protein